MAYIISARLPSSDASSSFKETTGIRAFRHAQNFVETEQQSFRCGAMAVPKLLAVFAAGAKNLAWERKLERQLKNSIRLFVCTIRLAGLRDG